MLTKFEDYLRDKHADDYAGTDDDMQDDYEAWLENLDNEELIEFGNQVIQEIVDKANKLDLKMRDYSDEEYRANFRSELVTSL